MIPNANENITNAYLAKGDRIWLLATKSKPAMLSLVRQTVGVAETAKYELVSGPFQRDEEVVKRDVNGSASRYWSTWNGSLESRKPKAKGTRNQETFKRQHYRKQFKYRDEFQSTEKTCCHLIPCVVLCFFFFFFDKNNEVISSCLLVFKNQN